jgi:protein CpxP
MKSLKRLTCLVTLGLVLSPLAQAQDQSNKSGESRRGRGGDGKSGESQGGRGQMSPEARVEQLDKAVSLTAEQKTKVKEIYAKSAEEMRKAFGDAGGNREGNREKMMELMRSTREQVRVVLTDEQKKKFDELAPQRGGERGGRGKGEGRPKQQ